MGKAIAFRLLSSLGVVAGSSILVFCILYVLPGDVVMNMIDPSSMSLRPLPICGASWG